MEVGNIMKWNDHSRFNLSHAFLSPSQYSWVNYDVDKLKGVYLNNLRKQEGTELHEFASNAIKRKIKLANLKKALNQFVNDCIGFNMSSEVMLFYSFNCYGTADAIKFDESSNHLMIFDLKTGVSKPSFKQLDIYAALFCLEYKKDPYELTYEQRIYQGNGCEIVEPDPELIADIMAKIVAFDKELEMLKTEL